MTTAQRRSSLAGLAAVLLLACAPQPASSAPAAAFPSQLGAGAIGLPAAAPVLPLPSCSPAVSREVIQTDAPLLRPVPAEAQSFGIPSLGPEASAPSSPDYRHRLATTALGRPRLDRWCVWIEPPSGSPPADLWQTRWRAAVDRALAQWQELLPIRLVEDAASAQVRLWRRRPPLLEGPDGRRRASHGRAILELQRVRRGEVIRLEPSVEVLLSPAQREQAIEATALHELGHAFGLWGHSDDPADAMAAVPGAQPVLVLSRRDRASLVWLYGQPTPFGQPLSP